jgi:hypothetical protein
LEVCLFYSIEKREIDGASDPEEGKLQIPLDSGRRKQIIPEKNIQRKKTRVKLLIL